jgi:hypothetical protein
MIFESEQDRQREKKAIEAFVATFGGSFKKLDPLDIDYKIFDKDNQLIAYAEVKGRNRTIRNAYPLPISARKIVKLVDKRIIPLIIWACEDGIIYGRATELVGTAKWGGRPPRKDSVNDAEIMIYYAEQKDLKYVRFS